MQLPVHHDGQLTKDQELPEVHNPRPWSFLYAYQAPGGQKARPHPPEARPPRVVYKARPPFAAAGAQGRREGRFTMACGCKCQKDDARRAPELSARQEELAGALYQAYAANCAGRNAPLDMADWEGVVTDDDAAYAVQDAVMAKKGEPVAGYKVSLTSEETQRMFDSTCPLYGAQVAERFVATPCELDLSRLNEPLLEVEFCFKANEDLSPEDSLADVLRKCTVAGDMEVPDARFAAWFPTLSKYLVMSDCAVGGYVLYGREVDGRDLTVEGMAGYHAKCYHDGELVKEGDSSEILGNPVKSMKWLVEKLASQGKRFTAGMRASVGTVFVPPHLTAGTWRVEWDGPFGSLEATVR